METGLDQLFFIDKTPKLDANESACIRDSAEEKDEGRIRKRSNSVKKKSDIVLGLDDEEAELERLVLGGRPDNLFLDDDNQQISTKEVLHVESDDQQSDDQLEPLETDSSSKLLAKKRKPAWVDEDDNDVSIDIKREKRLRKLRKTVQDSKIDGKDYEKRLRSQYEKLVGCPEWAKATDKKIDSDDEDEFFRSTRTYLGRSENLPQTTISIRKVKDANAAKHSTASLKCLEFHPSSKVVLTAGLNKTLSLFQVDCETNPCIQSVFVDRFPVYTAHFTPDGQKILISSKQRHFYVFDMFSAEIKKIPGIKGTKDKSLEKFVVSPDGSCVAFLASSGYIHLVSLKTLQLICSMKMNGSVLCAAFSADGSYLYTFGGDGEVYVWDMQTKRCKHRFRDEGCLVGTCIDASKDGRYIACGSKSGVVNIYNEDCLSNRNPKPIKTVMNLTTSIDDMKFNPTSEILAISSRAVKDSLKLLHISSLTVVSNWPTRKGTLGYIQSLAFSPQSGYLAIGNDAGKALLFRLLHYPNE